MWFLPVSYESTALEPDHIGLNEGGWASVVWMADRSASDSSYWRQVYRWDSLGDERGFFNGESWGDIPWLHGPAGWS